MSPSSIHFKLRSSKRASILPLVRYFLSKKMQNVIKIFIHSRLNFALLFPCSLKTHKWWIFRIRNGPMYYLHIEDMFTHPNRDVKWMAAWELADNKINFYSVFAYRSTSDANVFTQFLSKGSVIFEVIYFELSVQVGKAFLFMYASLARNIVGIIIVSQAV